MLKSFINTLTCIILFNISSLCHSDELKTIDVAAFVYPPFSFINEAGEWAGADIDIASEALKMSGYKPNYITKPFKRLLLDLQTGNLPMSVPIVEGNNRESFVYFSNPISYLYNVLWKRKDSDIQWEKYEDLKGLTIGATKGYHYGAGFKEAGEKGLFKIDYMADINPELKNFKKTLRNRIDMFICEINVGRNIKNKYSPKFNPIDYAENGVGPKRPFSLAISKKYYENNKQEAKQILEKFNLALLTLSKDGFNKRVFEKYNMDIQMDEANNLLIEGNWRESAEQ